MKNNLRPLEEKDIPLMLEWMHDPEINKVYQANFSSMTEEKVRAFVEAGSDEENIHFAFVDETDTYLGTVSLKHVSHKDKNAEFAIATRRSAQGTGAAREATTTILKYAFEELKLHKVYLCVRVDNLHANHFYLKMGFTLEGTFHDHLLVKDMWKDLNWYAITAEEFTKKTRSLSISFGL